MGKKLKAILISTMLMFMLGTTQVVNVSSAFAADGNNADFFIYVGSSKTEYMPGAFYDNNWIQVCSYGAGSIKTIDFDIQATNWNMTQLSVQERNEWNTATDLGSVDLNGVWNGLIEDNQCFTLFPWGTVTGNVGDTLTETVSVTSSTLVDDTPNQGVIQENSSPTISYPIVTPVYQVDLQTYIGMGNNQTTVYPDQTYQNWFNVCASGYGSVSEFDLDVQTSNWSNVTYSVQDNQWSNQDVLDKGTIDANGHWTGLMQAGQCVSFGGQGTVSGEIGQQASWNLNLLSSKLGDGSDNPGSLNNGGQPNLVQDIVEIVPDVDLNVYVGNNNVVFPVNGQYSNSWVHICASGFGAVEQMDFSFETQGWTMTRIEPQQVYDAGNTATDPGSLTPEGVWTGELRAGECLVILQEGQITAPIGETVSFTVTINSSVLVGGEPNPDSNQNNQTMTVSAPVGEPGDLAIQTRLLTSGDISEGSDVSYEVNVSNIGVGDIYSDQVGLYYLLPAGADLLGVVDTNLSDPYSLLGCTSIGQIQDLGPAFHLYTGEVIQCLFTSSLGIVPSGASFPLQINIQTGQGFTSNQTEVYGVVLAGNLSEPDSYEFAHEFQMGRDGFALYSNNIMHLVYDNNELQVTINRCPGTGEEINVDDACFNVEFSKPIWAPSFDQSDLILDGGGNVYSFVQNSSTEWTIRINGMTAGGTLRVRLGQASVSDYSAIQNGASVLGENVVRYAATDSNSTSEGSSNSGVSTGTTGSHSGNSLTALTNSSTSGATTLTPSIGTISGLMSEIPEVAKSVLNPNHLLLGSWSFTKSNILDFSFILVNMSGIMAAILIFANRRRIKALRNS